VVARLLARLESLRPDDVAYTIASEECRSRELLLSVLEVDKKLVALQRPERTLHPGITYTSDVRADDRQADAEAQALEIA
jgi:hypothetical protein